MSKQNYEHGYLPHQTKRSFAGQLWGRAGGGRLRQGLTYVTALITVVALLFSSVGETRARPLFATAPGLGTAGSFAVLGGSTVTNTGPTIVTGELGVSPGTAVTGFPPGSVIGTIHSADAVALQAQSDVTTAYNDLASQACDTDLTGLPGQDLGGLTLTPGVYCFSSSAFLTGILTLDAQGDPGAVFVFQIGSTLITAPNSSVVVINGADVCNVFWQVGSSATLDTTTTFLGNILALTSITLNTGASVSGRALARNGAVTMDSNTVTQSCPVTQPTPVATDTATPVATDTATPTPTSTPVGTATNTPVGTATNTPVGTATNTPVGTATNTPVGTATNTGTPIGTPTGTQVPSALDPVNEPVVTGAYYLPLVEK